MGTVPSQSGNLIDETVGVLIALGAAIAANCGDCFRHYYAEALRLDIPVQDMIEAVEIGDNVRRAAANHVIDVAEGVLIHQKPASGGCCGSSKDSGCSGKGGGCR